MFDKVKMSLKLKRYIFDNLMCFGPKRLGSNLLINKFGVKEDSFFRNIERLLGEKLLPEL